MTHNNAELEWFADLVDEVFGEEGQQRLENEVMRRLHTIVEMVHRNPSAPGTLAEAVCEWWLHR